jgi:hypothetical protein
MVHPLICHLLYLLYVPEAVLSSVPDGPVTDTVPLQIVVMPYYDACWERRSVPYLPIRRALFLFARQILTCLAPSLGLLVRLR